MSEAFICRRGGSGGAALNIDFGANPPSDTSKLWVPLTKKPDAVECSPVLNYGANTIELKSAIVPASQVGFPAISRVGRKIYILGGSNNLSTGGMVKTISVYDIDSGEISTLSATLSVSRMYAYCAAVNGKIYLIGGVTNGSTSPSNTIEAFDPATNTITACTNLPTAFRTMNCNSCVVVGSKIYIMGYLYGSGTYNLSILYYDTENDTVVDTGKKGITCNAACVYVNGKIYGFGGVSSGGSFSGKYWSFDPVALEVTTLGTYSYNYMSAASVDNEKIYLFQGYDNNNFKNAIQVYDVSTNTFQTLSIQTSALLGRRNVVVDGLDIYIMLGDRASSAAPENRIEKLSTNTVLQSNHLFLQADFGLNNPFPIASDKNTKITAYLRNAFLGNENNIAQQTNAFIYDATAGEWKNLSGESYVADMLNALNVMGVN